MPNYIPIQGLSSDSGLSHYHIKSYHFNSVYSLMSNESPFNTYIPSFILALDIVGIM